MPAIYSQEKRKSARFLITIPLKYVMMSIRNLNLPGTRDISAHGVGLVTAEELPVNTPLTLCLKIPDNGEEILLDAQVVWSARIDSSKYRSGLKFKSGQVKAIPLVLRTIYSKL